MGLNNVANMETEVTHHGMVPSPLKNSFPFISFLEKKSPATIYITGSTAQVTVNRAPDIRQEHTLS